MIKLLDPLSLRESPFQTRPDLQVMLFDDLIRSIRINGQIEPIEAYLEPDGQYTILEGHRRTLACAKLGYKVRARIVKKPEDCDISKMIWVRNTVRRKHKLSGVVLKMLIGKVQTANLTGWRRSMKSICQELGIPYMVGRRAYSLFKRLTINHPRVAEQAVKEKWGVWEIERFLGGPDRDCLGVGHVKAGVKRPSWGRSICAPVSIDIVTTGKAPVVMCTMQEGVDVSDLQDWFEHHGWTRPMIDGVETPRIRKKAKAWKQGKVEGQSKHE